MIDAFLAAPLAQAVGFAGTLGGMSWPLFRGRFGMLMAQLATSLCFAAHYGMLGAGTGCAMNLLAAAQAVVAVPLGVRPGFRAVYLGTLPLVAAGVALTWNGLPSVFGALGFGLVSVARYQTDVRRFRIAMALALPCWFGHNLLVASVPGMTSDIVGMTLNLMVLTGRVRRQPATS